MWELVDPNYRVREGEGAHAPSVVERPMETITICKCGRRLLGVTGWYMMKNPISSFFSQLATKGDQTIRTVVQTCPYCSGERK